MQPDTLVIHSLADAPTYIWLHLAVAVTALLIGLVLLLCGKGTRSHKLLGRLWAILMLTAAISSFFIQGRGRLSLIHVLSVVVLIAIPYGVYSIRTQRLRAHRRTMLITYASLWIAGLFTLLPYRMLGQLIFR